MIYFDSSSPHPNVDLEFQFTRIQASNCEECCMERAFGAMFVLCYGSSYDSRDPFSGPESVTPGLAEPGLVPYIVVLEDSCPALSF